ncbi:hypothetical protein PVAP13_9NG560100 [Panicum virgatum]|nr:hypothetical protein PVAP13_9NG560100 [Panicum virgatum]
MSTSLFLLGEIGGNDYNHPFFQNRSFADEIRPLVPKVIDKIENATKVLIGLGAKNIVVPGAFPLGCVPRFLTLFPSDDPSDYDAARCLNRRRRLRRRPGDHPRPSHARVQEGRGADGVLRRRRASQLRRALLLQRHLGPVPGRAGAHLVGRRAPHRGRARTGSWRGACWTGRTPRRPYCPHADADPKTEQLPSRVQQQQHEINLHDNACPAPSRYNSSQRARLLGGIFKKFRTRQRSIEFSNNGWALFLSSTG